jgi:hypothetical protein
MFRDARDEMNRIKLVGLDYLADISEALLNVKLIANLLEPLGVQVANCNRGYVRMVLVYRNELGPKTQADQGNT